MVFNLQWKIFSIR